jgi:uncharacterized protein
MEAVTYQDVARFRAAAGPFMVRDVARNQLPLAIAHTIETHPEVYPEFLLWTAQDDDDVVGAALRTPPHNVVLADPTNPGAVDVLVDAIRRDDPDAPGVVANVPWAERFAARWSWSTGVTPRLSVLQGVFRLTEVRSPRPSPGSKRRCGSADRGLVQRWFDDFGEEALPREMRERSRQRSRVDSLLDQRDDSGGLWCWELDGRPRSMTGFTTMDAGARIGPVYTPPADRGRGFASNLVAEVSGWLLDRGAAACYLYTDLANPTSNKVYIDVGYEQVAESANLEFDR